jgi:ADP-ribosylglycohydrolase/fructose-1,6-bisphosphatase/inositol monophosphatase family enzyme
MDLRRALEVAQEAALAAGELLGNDFHRPGGARGQGDKAEADVEAETLIRSRLLRAFPDWSYLGEETGRVSGPPDAPIWLVDPNDGTRDYLKGRRGSAVSIGLVAERRPVLGVVFAFAYPDDRGDLFAWAEGTGPLRRNGRAVEARVPESLGPLDVVLVSSKGDRDPEGHLRCAEPARYRAVPSIAHRLALAAAGEAAAVTSLFAPGAWDYAAGQALLRPAGGTLVDETGAEVVYTDAGESKTMRAYAGSPGVARELAGRPWEKVGGQGREARRLARLRPGETITDPDLLARAQGCLLGQIAGDSLGSLVEFQASGVVAARYPDGPRLLEDGGQWGTLAGQPTDDSEMALALARSIVDTGRYEPAAAQSAYREWFASKPFDIGSTTRAALEGHPWPESQSNGSLMRASPLAVFGHTLPVESMVALAHADSALTHPHPVCGDAVAAFVIAVRHALAGEGPERAWEAALAWARSAARPSVAQALEAATSSPPVCDSGSQGFVLITLQNAFFELLHAPSLEEGVVATVRRGGDTDTNAAVAGALLGAVRGREDVPGQWRQMVLSCRAHVLRARHPRPLAYWPVDVLELAERLLLAGRADAESSGRRR